MLFLELKKSGFDGFIISISNPADVVATYLCKHLNWNPKRIISSGTALDSARLQKNWRAFLILVTVQLQRIV